MPNHFVPCAAHFSPGGYLRAEQPEDIPPRVFARWMGADGKLQVGELDVIDADNPIPGEVGWTSIVDWIDITKIR